MEFTADDRVKLLVVASDAVERRRLEAALSVEGRDLHEADSAAAADRLLDEHEIALVVLDLDLPSENGSDVLAHLRRSVRDGTVPIIVLAGQADTAARTRWFALGADEVIGKPYNPDLLTASVAARLRRATEITRWARRDMLTGLPNRAAFIRSFARLQELTPASRPPITVGIVDIDGLKFVNDTYGHAKGDEILKRVAEVLAASLRRSDTLARWGGEEFVVIFPDTDEAGAALALNQALLALRVVRFSGGTNGDTRAFAVTFSGGVAEARRDSSLEDTLQVADRLLYRAKTAGRNMVLTAAGSVLPTRKVLLVEDDLMIATLVRGVLANDGLETVHIVNGARAAVSAAGPGFSLVILDVLLPGMDGFEVLKGLRRSPSGARVPVLMLTSLKESSDIAKGFELGADDYVVKPFSPIELQARVRRLLRRA